MGVNHTQTLSRREIRVSMSNEVSLLLFFRLWCYLLEERQEERLSARELRRSQRGEVVPVDTDKGLVSLSPLNYRERGKSPICRYSNSIHGDFRSTWTFC